MKNQILACLLLVSGMAAHAQCAPIAGVPTNLQVTQVTATTATITFDGGANGGSFGNLACATRISYAYAGESPVSVSYAMPLLLTGLRPGNSLAVSVVRYGANSLAAGPSCCARPTATITFTTASMPLVVVAATGTGSLALAPNPAHGSATLTLAAPLPRPATVLVLDAVGREVRRQPLPAHAATATLDVAGLPAGLYLVRADEGTTRLVVE